MTGTALALPYYLLPCWVVADLAASAASLGLQVDSDCEQGSV
jgi:hypothetical protein